MAAVESRLKLTVRPLTPDRWPALEDLFGRRGACGGCWCMYWRIGSAYHRRPHLQNKAAFREIVRRGPPPGLLAFDGDVAVGWCQLTPRAALPWLDRAWRLRRLDTMPVWSISCFYVRRGYRRRGVTSVLIRAALKAARRMEAPALEAYPLDAKLTPSASGTGYASTSRVLDSRRSRAVCPRARSCAAISRRSEVAPRFRRSGTGSGQRSPYAKAPARRPTAPASRRAGSGV